MDQGLSIVNLDEARFECTFGRGCDGVCCKEGRPLVYPEEVERIAGAMAAFLPRLRPEARAVAMKKGFLSGRRRLGHPVLRGTWGWCLFFHGGGVLHQVGLEEGDKFRYKPAVCALFPIQQDEHDRWYIRQRGFHREKWGLSCLDPGNHERPAAETLREEIALAKRFDDEAKSRALSRRGRRPGSVVPEALEVLRPDLVVGEVMQPDAGPS